MQLFANNIETTLAAGLSSAAISLTVTDATGMPEPSGNEYFLLTLCKRTGDVETDIEIVKCTARTGAVLTIERAQEGTVAGTYVAGDIAGMRLTAGSLEDGILPDLSIGRINNPLLHLSLKNSLDMICGVGSVTFTRSTTATYIDRYGVVQSAAINAARFEAEGLLSEGASENKFLQSEDFSTTWQKNNAGDTISANAIAAPDGNTTADGIIGNTSDLSHGFYQDITVNADNIYTMSCFLKKGNENHAWVQLKTWDTSWVETGYGRAWFDLDIGVIGSYVEKNSNITVDNYKIKELANGWYRCELTVTIAAGTDVTHARVYLCGADNDAEIAYVGDGSTINTYFWGAQLEELLFASSYIPTTTAAVTRTADVCNVTYADNVPAPNDVMTILADISLLGLNAANHLAWKVEDETNRMLHAYYVAVDAVILFNGGSGYSSVPKLTAVTLTRLGVTFDETTNKIYVDGVLADSDAQVSAITGTAIALRLASNLFGHISNFRIYDVALSEDEMRIA